MKFVRNSTSLALVLTAGTYVVLNPGAAFAQGVVAKAQADSGAKDEAEIVVIGTRRADRTVTDSASPVDVISSAEINSQPATNVLDAVRAIVPSFFVPQNTLSDASTFVRAPSLRGLPSDEILVMLNGKRFNRSALVQVYGGGDTALSYGAQGSDISTIPAIAIRDLQILRDGATAQYGSDAIGGVLNYGLRDDAGIELQTRYGQYLDKGDGKSYQLAGNFGLRLGDVGFINLSGEYFDDGETSRGATRPVAAVFAQLNPNLASQLPNYPNPVQNWGSSPSNGWKAILNMGIDVSDNSQIYFLANVAHSKSDQSFNYRSPFSVPTPLAVDDGSATPATASPEANGIFSHPVYLTPCPTTGVTGCAPGGFVKDANVFNFSSLYPAGFTPRFVGVVDQAWATLGYKGETQGQLSYDLAVTLARNELGLSMYNSVSPSFGPQSATAFEFGQLIQKELNANLDLTYPIEVGLLSPLTFSFGAELRRETYEQTEGDVQSYAAGPYAVQDLYIQTGPTTYAFDSTVDMGPGASGYGGTSPRFAGAFSQTSYGAYVGLEGDLSERLSFGAAGRYEHYDTFGGTVVGKLNALYKVSDAFSIRGTMGTGFHAPSPGQNNVSILTTAFVAGQSVEVGTYPVTSSIAQYYGAKSLRPAKATNFGLGFVLKPADNLTVTVDGYSISVRNRIGISSSFNVSAADLIALPDLAAVGLDGSVNYFTNAFSTTTKGVDFVGTYRTDLGGGRLNLTLAYNYNKSRVTKFDPTVIGASQIADIKHLAPNHRANFSANWTMGDFTLNFRESYYGWWATQNDYPGQKFGAKFLTDIDVSYKFADRFTLTAGVNNLFNTYPDRIAPSVDNPIFALTNSTESGQVYPRSGGPFGMNGGLWYVKLAVKY